MSSLADRTVADLVALVARTEPAPAGGACAAITCALGAALVEMAAALSDRDVVAERAGQIRGLALDLADRDGAAFGSVLVARRLAPGDERDRRLAAALSGAADVPLQIAQLAAEVRELAAGVEADGATDLVGDAAVAGQLGQAAATGAARLVTINLADTPHDPRHARAAALSRH